MNNDRAEIKHDDDDKSWKVLTLQDMENDSLLIGMYAFYDTKAKKYDTPFFCQSDLFAKRHYTLVLDRSEMIKEFQDDFEVHRIGFFDLETAHWMYEHGVVIDPKSLPKEEK
jgi:hypothetical protein